MPPEFALRLCTGGEPFVLDTAEIRSALDGVPLSTPDVLEWIRAAVEEGIESTIMGL